MDGVDRTERQDAASRQRFDWGSGITVAAFALVLAVPALPAAAAPPPDCVKPAVILWGDGKHDDTVALNAWLRGDNALWGESGGPVGAAIVGHDFRLSSAIYVSGGTGRTLEDFRMAWPERHESITGGTIRSGRNPNQAPSVSGVRIVGGDAGEGTPFDMPDMPPLRPNAQTNCGIS